MRRKHFWLLGPDTGGGNSAGSGNGETPPASASTGETPSTGTGETPATTTTPLSAEDAQKEIERLQAALKRANSEAKTHREKATELDTLKKQIEDEKLSEKEKLEKRLAEAQREREQTLTRAQERITASEIRAAAADLGFADPQDAARLLDRSELEFDEDGTPKNARALLEKLAKAKPYLLKQQAGQQTQRASGGATNPPRSQTAGQQTITKEYINGVLKGGTEAWSALSADEQTRISAFIRNGGLMRR